MDLTRAAAYRVESSPDGNDLTVRLRRAVRRADRRADAGRRPLRQTPAGARRSAAGRLRARRQPRRRPPATQVPGGGAAPQRYTGNPVSLDFQGADLRAVLRTFSEISGLNIVIDPTIQGTVDVALRDVPWDQALDIILRANKLGYVVDGTIVRIAPLTVLADEEAQRRKLSDEQALAGELRVLTRSLSYAQGRGPARAAHDHRAVAARLDPDRRADQHDHHQRPGRPPRRAPATLIDDARSAASRRSRSKRASCRRRASSRARSACSGASTAARRRRSATRCRSRSRTRRASAAAPAGVAGPGRADADATRSSTLASTAPRSALGLALGSINGALNLDVALSALERQGQGRLLSTPRVSTQNNIEAEITQGIQIPIQTVANNTVTVTFRDAALTLRVTPQITAANTVIMRISVENAAPDFSRSVNDIPPIDTQRALTQVLVSNGETTVIGGIYVSREQTSQDRTPGLHRLPLLGWLFKRDERHRREPRAADLHHAADRQAVGVKSCETRRSFEHWQSLLACRASIVAAGCGEFARQGRSPVAGRHQSASQARVRRRRRRSATTLQSDVITTRAPGRRPGVRAPSSTTPAR